MFLYHKQLNESVCLHGKKRDGICLFGVSRTKCLMWEKIDRHFFSNTRQKGSHPPKKNC